MGKGPGKRRKKRSPAAAALAALPIGDDTEQHEDTGMETLDASEAAEAATTDSPAIDPASNADTSTAASSDPDQLEEEHNTKPQHTNQGGQVAEQPSMTPADAKRVLRRFFMVLLMARRSPHTALKPLCGRSSVSVDEVEHAMQAGGWEDSLLPIEASAILAFAAVDTAVDAQKLVDVAGAIAFKVELCEFQIREQMRGKSSGKASRGKMDLQRVISRLVASSVGPDALEMTSDRFESLLEQKLGLAAGQWLANVVFARIVRLPFQRRMPLVLTAPRLAFVEALERFCLLPQFSLESVEGQVRELVNKHTDLRKAFEAMDTDNSGTISAEELIDFLRQEAHMDFPVDVLRAFIERFDADGNGALDYREFVDFVRPKQFGVQVLSPFGLFYLPLDRLAMMKEVEETIATRMFWLQHNDLLATTAANARKQRPSSTSSRVRADKQQSAPVKLKVTEQFQLTRHFGTLPIEFDGKAAVASVLDNGELVVLVSAQSGTTASRGDSLRIDRSSVLTEFAYRFKSSAKRNIPMLMAHATLLQP